MVLDQGITQLLEMMEDFTDFYEEAKPFDCVYLDFAKAFDRVPHQKFTTLASKVKYSIGSKPSSQIDYRGL